MDRNCLPGIRKLQVALQGQLSLSSLKWQWNPRVCHRNPRVFYKTPRVCPRNHGVFYKILEFVTEALEFFTETLEFFTEIPEVFFFPKTLELHWNTHIFYKNTGFCHWNPQVCHWNAPICCTTAFPAKSCNLRPCFSQPLLQTEMLRFQGICASSEQMNMIHLIIHFYFGRSLNRHASSEMKWFVSKRSLQLIHNMIPACFERLFWLSSMVPYQIHDTVAGKWMCCSAAQVKVSPLLSTPWKGK